MNNDLISREALKKTFENLASDDYNEPIWYRKTVFETIDNAPTVSEITKEKLSNAYDQGYEDGKNNWLQEERTQGNWMFDEKGNFYCDQCGKYPHDQYVLTDFCPSCGAKMKNETF